MLPSPGQLLYPYQCGFVVTVPLCGGNCDFSGTSWIQLTLSKRSIAWRYQNAANAVSCHTSGFPFALGFLAAAAAHCCVINTF